MKKILLIFISVFILLPVLNSKSESKLYKYVDKDGNTNYVDNPMAVPPKYREKTKEVQPETGVNMNFERTSYSTPEDVNAADMEDDGSNKPSAQTEEDIRKEWEKRAYCARSKLKYLKKQQKTLESSLAALNRQKDALGSIGLMQGVANTDGMMNAMKMQIKQQEQYISTGLPNEARRAGVPLYWLKGKKVYKCEDLQNMQAQVKSAAQGYQGLTPGGSKAKSGEDNKNKNSTIKQILQPNEYFQKTGGVNKKSKSGGPSFP